MNNLFRDRPIYSDTRLENTGYTMQQMQFGFMGIVAMILVRAQNLDRYHVGFYPCKLIPER